jgi:hypothetical protein
MKIPFVDQCDADGLAPKCKSTMQTTEFSTDNQDVMSSVIAAALCALRVRLTAGPRDFFAAHDHLQSMVNRFSIELATEHPIDDAVADQVTEEDLSSGLIYPPRSHNPGRISKSSR